MKHLKFCNLITNYENHYCHIAHSIFNSIPDITIQCYSMANEEKSIYELRNPTLRIPSDSRSQEESAYPGYHLAYEVKKLMYASYFYVNYHVKPLCSLFYTNFVMRYRNLLANCMRMFHCLCN